MLGIINPEISRAIAEIARIGTVCELEEGKSLVKIDLGDGLVSDLVPLMQISSPSVAMWVKPEIGEQVLLISPNGTAGKGIALRGIYNIQRLEPNDAKGNIAIIDFKDGLQIKYDGEKLTIKNSNSVELRSSELKIECSGNVELKAPTVKVNSTDISLGENAAFGVVTQDCMCLVGGFHPEGSAIVKAKKIKT